MPPVPPQRTSFIVPGQVPRRQQQELDRLTAKPAPIDMATERLAFTDPVLTLPGVTRGLPMEATVEKAFQKFVSGIVKSANEVEFRQQLVKHLHYDMKAEDPTLRRALLQRSLAYYKSAGVSPNEARTRTRAQGLRMDTKIEPKLVLEKAEARGGNYHRRVTDKDGKHKYFYTPEDYAAHGDAHLNGDEVKRGKARKAVLDAVGDAGSTVEAMKGLSGKHDPEHIADAIRAHVKSGDLVHAGNGKLTKPKVEKSVHVENTRPMFSSKHRPTGNTSASKQLADAGMGGEERAAISAKQPTLPEKPAPDAPEGRMQYTVPKLEKADDKNDSTNPAFEANQQTPQEREEDLRQQGGTPDEKPIKEPTADQGKKPQLVMNISKGGPGSGIKGHTTAQIQAAAMAHHEGYKQAKAAGDEAAMQTHKEGFEQHKTAWQASRAADANAAGMTSSGKRVLAPSTAMVHSHYQSNQGQFKEPGSVEKTHKLIAAHVAKHKDFTPQEHAEAATILHKRGDEITNDKSKGKHQDARNDKARLYHRVANEHAARSEAPTEKSMLSKGGPGSGVIGHHTEPAYKTAKTKSVQVREAQGARGDPGGGSRTFAGSNGREQQHTDPKLQAEHEQHVASQRAASAAGSEARLAGDKAKAQEHYTTAAAHGVNAALTAPTKVKSQRLASGARSDAAMAHLQSPEGNKMRPAPESELGKIHARAESLERSMTTNPANLHEFIAKSFGDDDNAMNGDTTNGKEPNGATNGGDTNGPVDEKVAKGDMDNDADDGNPGGVDTDGDDQGGAPADGDAPPSGGPPKKKDDKPDVNINSDPNGLDKSDKTPNMLHFARCGGDVSKGGACAKCGYKMTLSKGIPGADAPTPKTKGMHADTDLGNGDGDAEGSKVNINAEADVEASDHVVKGLHGWLRKADDEDMAGDGMDPKHVKLDADAEQEFDKSYLDSIEPTGIFALSKAMGPFIGPHGGKWADAAHKIAWSDKQHSGKPAPVAKPHDEHGAEDLHMTAANEGSLHGMHESIRANLVNKMAAGTYDHAQATKLYGHMMTNASKKMGGGKPAHDVPTRNAAAKDAADQFASEAKNGEHDRLLNKKNATKVAKHQMSNPEGNAYTAGGIDKKSAAMAKDKHEGAVVTAAMNKPMPPQAHGPSGPGGPFGGAPPIAKQSFGAEMKKVSGKAASATQAAHQASSVADQIPGGHAKAAAAHHDASNAQYDAKVFHSRKNEEGSTADMHQHHKDMEALHDKQAAVHEAKARTEKSMSNAKNLHDYLAKAGIPDASDSSGGDKPSSDLPKGAPAMSQGADVNGEPAGETGKGGDLDNMTLDGGVDTGALRSNTLQRSGPGTMASVQTTSGGPGAGKVDKLSEDDGDGTALPTGEPGLISKPPEMGSSGNLAIGKSVQGPDDQASRLHNAAVQWQRNQPTDVHVPANAARAPARAAAPGPKATGFMQKGGLVAYSDASDLAVEEMMKASESGFSVPISQVGIAGSPMLKSVACGNCGGHTSAMVTRCTHCGYDGNTLSKAQPSAQALPSRLQTAKPVADIYIPRKR